MQPKIDSCLLGASTSYGLRVASYGLRVAGLRFAPLSAGTSLRYDWLWLLITAYLSVDEDDFTKLKMWIYLTWHQQNMISVYQLAL